MMRLWLDPGAGGARLEFDRAGPDFGERDRAVLDLLLPHLKQFRRSAATRRRESAGHVNGADRLTLREREILHRVAEGRTNAEVAWLLRISPQTVRKHLENAYEKLGVHARTGAVAALFELEDEIA
jgi:DNA-binding CsgD family transcriptional regulator